MQLREAQHWFVLLLIKHITETEVIDRFFSHHLIPLGKTGKFVGTSLQ